jgi:hypothetical protein
MLPAVQRRAHRCPGRHACQMLERTLSEGFENDAIHGWQVCDDMVWERDARYGIDSRARAQNRQVREA